MIGSGDCVIYCVQLTCVLEKIALKILGEKKEEKPAHNSTNTHKINVETRKKMSFDCTKKVPIFLVLNL